jgi:hypothetical protein
MKLCCAAYGACAAMLHVCSQIKTVGTSLIISQFVGVALRVVFIGQK